MPENEEVVEEIILEEQNNNEDNTPEECTVPIALEQQTDENHDNLALNIREKKTRRRKSDPKLWKASQRKEKRNKGVEYVGAGGMIRLQRFPKNIGQICNCTLKCHVKINDDKKSAIFKAFWDLGNLEKQRGFIIKHVQRATVKRTRTNNSRRGFSQTYVLGLNNQNVTVCKTFFLKTLDISEKMVRTALNKSDRNLISLCSPDQRGYHVPANRLNEEVINIAKCHIDSFPRVPAHWCRKDSKKEYLEPILNKTKMFELYKKYCAENHFTAISETAYRNILLEKNIGFHVPRKDQCWCYKYEQQLEEDQHEKERYDLHIKRKNAANKEKKGTLT